MCNGKKTSARSGGDHGGKISLGASVEQHGKFVAFHWCTWICVPKEGTRRRLLDTCLQHFRPAVCAISGHKSHLTTPVKDDGVSCALDESCDLIRVSVYGPGGART